ncbi:hypothetical protein [Actinomadura flavalba]|uniref:hypothetical protein n=1 Tax=Actinomadura flavalba TaxID=1120938 RepID=UPI000374B71A|nr:hypothetical protein [Actinomadura flavalba]
MRLLASDHYFRTRPFAEHDKECSRVGTSLWEVSQHEQLRLRVAERGGNYTETTTRYLCRECGVACLVRTDSRPDETTLTTTAAMGYGSPPVRQHGVWLHPGPLPAYRPGDGPDLYYLTEHQDAPRTPAAVLGLVCHHRTQRGALRWSAGVGLTSDTYSVRRNAGDTTFPSRGAAVRWVVAEAAADRALAVKAAEAFR